MNAKDTLSILTKEERALNCGTTSTTPAGAIQETTMAGVFSNYDPVEGEWVVFDSTGRDAAGNDVYPRFGWKR